MPGAPGLAFETWDSIHSTRAEGVCPTAGGYFSRAPGAPGLAFETWDSIHSTRAEGVCPTAGGYFSRAPSGTSSRKPVSTGAPPSSEAASNMPFDSRPRILRGARLATITIFLPISFSGS
jgi:hypothetical protein